jgi:hypothetical protein
LVGAFYFGSIKKPWVSALLFAISAFDPRASVFALPLLLWYNREKILQFVSGSAIFLAVTNLPFFFYYNIGLTFLQTGISGDIASQMYNYDWLPLYAVLALTVMEIIAYGNANRSVNHRIQLKAEMKKPADRSGFGLSRKQNPWL